MSKPNWMETRKLHLGPALGIADRRPAFLKAASFAAGMGLCLALLAAGCRPAAQDATSDAPVAVVAVPAQQQAIHENLSLVGSLSANEMVEIKSEIDGVVKTIGFKEGQPVKKGRLLIQLDDTKLSAALNQAEANYHLSKSTYSRSVQLFKDHLISQQEFDQSSAVYEADQANLALKRRLLQDARIIAPFDGVMGARNVSPGQVISKNTTLTWLVDLDPIKVEVDVPERFLGEVHLKQQLDLKVAAFPDQIFKGTVYFISAFVDPATRTALLKARIANPKHLLKPGMFANLDLTLKVRTNSVVIPEAALAQVMDNDEAGVFVVDGNDIVHYRKVKVGVRLPGRVEIRDGLQKGDEVVVEGVQKVGRGSKVVLDHSGEAAYYMNPTRKSKPVVRVQPDHKS